MNCIYGKTIYTGKSVVRERYLVFDKTTLKGLSTGPSGKLLGRFDVVTPAFIDAHSHIGIHRAAEPRSEGESNEHMDSILVLSDVLDSIQMDDIALQDAMAMGVGYACVMPGSSNLIGGRSAVIRLYGKTSSEALMARAGLKAALGYNLMAAYSHKGTRGSTRMGSMAILRKRLDDARTQVRQYRSANAAKRRDMVFTAEDKVFRDILAGRERLRVHAHKVDDIAALLRLVDDFGLRVSVEHAMNVDDENLFRELKRRNIPVVYGPVDSFASKVELARKSWRNIILLVQSGVGFGLMTDHPVVPAVNLLIQTRWFLRAGLSKQQAVELVSRRNAEILGIQKVLGTLDKGKWASFTGWNGDPFALTSYPVAVYGEGRCLYEE